MCVTLNIQPALVYRKKNTQFQNIPMCSNFDQLAVDHASHNSNDKTSTLSPTRFNGCAICLSLKFPDDL